MTVSLRPHHLLCILTYLGKGYTDAFVQGYDEIIARLNSGEAIRLVFEPDDICSPMLKESNCHCHNDSVHERDLVAAREVGQLLGIEIAAGAIFVLSSEQTDRLRAAFSAGTVRTACAGCEWLQLCTGIARSNYRGCHLAPPAQTS